MTPSPPPGDLKQITWDIDPRRSLAAGAMWLIIALAVVFSVAAALWVGSIARANVIEQHVRRLMLETDQLSSDLGQALASRLGAVRAARTLLRGFEGAPRPIGLARVFDELESAYPDLDWLAIADAGGVIVNAHGALQRASRVDSKGWFSAGLNGPWLGMLGDHPNGALGDFAAPVLDESGGVVGVIAARLRLPRASSPPLRLTEESDPEGVTQAYVLDREGIVLLGPDGVGQPWSGVALGERAPAPADVVAQAAAGLRFERLPNGRPVLVSRAALHAGGGVSALGWQVLLSEPRERVFRRADGLGLQILWVSLCLGAATATLGTIGARQLTRRLHRLTQSVASIQRNDAARIEVPPGRDEVSQLAAAFARILEDLGQERRELKSLSSELERRVAVRTREVERFADESHYAAMVRERLKIARDLHDTLAHSMMAMLSEIRFLRKLEAHDPASVARELERAEQVAHEGLKEARSAITQMRVGAVRDMGLGPALSNAFDRFIDHTGLTGEFSADAAAARFGDDRAEAMLRMANEALRNVERHARATRVKVTLQTLHGTHLQLRIEDNGVGFDPQAHRPGHFGIVGLREQAEIIGAELTIDSRPNRGTEVIVSLRLSPVSFHEASSSSSVR